MNIKINNLKLSGNTIEIDYSANGLENYMNTSITPFYTYDDNIEDVPKSIAIIPFICNILPICFVLDFTIEVDEIDKSFYNCIDDYRRAYQQMIPMINFKGTVKANKIVENHNNENESRACLLFSGGIDATNSLVMNKDIISDCITIWGADIKYDNTSGWDKMYSGINDIVNKFNKTSRVIRTNMREYIKEDPLTQVVANSHDNWWHGFQHGIALLGNVAPLAYKNKYSKILIASSFTKEFHPICASDPRTDTCFKVADTYTVHDGYEYDRCEKVQNIYNWIRENNTNLNVHVCWESTTGSNCGHCEKCLRSYLDCRSMGYNGLEIGIIPTITMKEIKRFYKRKLDIKNNNIYSIKCVSKHLKNTYSPRQVPPDLVWLIDFDLAKENHSFYHFVKKCYIKVLSILKRK